MHPVFIEIFGRTIYWYGVMVALGYLAVITYWRRTAQRLELPDGFSSTLAMWVIISAIIGARTAYVLANWSEYAANPWTVLRIDQGGLVYYGGFIGGVLGFVLFARIKRYPLFALGDFAISGLPLGHAFGRIGCLLNGCCYGKACSCALSVHMHDADRIPVQLYEALLNGLLFAGLAWLFRHRKRDGIVVVAYFLLYPPMRFLLEMFRGDTRITYAGLNLAQLTSIGLFIAGIIILLSVPKKLTPLHVETKVSNDR